MRLLEMLPTQSKEELIVATGLDIRLILEQLAFLEVIMNWLLLRQIRVHLLFRLKLWLKLMFMSLWLIKELHLIGFLKTKRLIQHLL